MTSLLEQAVAAFGGTHVRVADLPDDDPTAKIGRECESLFTGGVEVLRSIVPSDRIRSIGSVIWDLVGHKQVLVAIGPDVPTLSFTVMKLKELHQAIVLIPKKWSQMVTEEPFMQLGAILFVGAQAVDFYNDRLIGDKGARVRWQAYEAELLLAIREALPKWSPNEYQQQILAKYPAGLDTPGVELYAYKPYVPPKGVA